MRLGRKIVEGRMPCAIDRRDRILVFLDARSAPQEEPVAVKRTVVLILRSVEQPEPKGTQPRPLDDARQLLEVGLRLLADHSPSLATGLKLVDQSNFIAPRASANF